jgi:hypothetical protein
LPLKNCLQRIFSRLVFAGALCPQRSARAIIV